MISQFKRNDVFLVFADLLFDGLRALKKGSPNMNSLVGFGSVVAFIISAVLTFLQLQDDMVLLHLISLTLFSHVGVSSEP